MQISITNKTFVELIDLAYFGLIFPIPPLAAIIAAYVTSTSHVRHAPSIIVKFAAHAFSLRQLQYFIAVANTLSFRKAAELCHVSQPSLSAQLAGLEEALGVRLFERDTKRVMLTRSGEALVRRATKILVDVEDLTSAALTHGDQSQ